MFTPPGRWAEPNYPSVINKLAETQPDAPDKFMTEATSMSVITIILDRPAMRRERHT